MRQQIRPGASNFYGKISNSFLKADMGVAALEYATDRPATIVGKPEPEIFLTALDRLRDGRTLVIGDRLDADLQGAAAADLDAAIVLTGVASLEQASAASDPAPVAVADDLRALVMAP